MIMRKKGSVSDGSLVIEDNIRLCPRASSSSKLAFCGTWCAYFDTIIDKNSKTIGAYMGCIDKQWTFTDNAD